MRHLTRAVMMVAATAVTLAACSSNEPQPAPSSEVPAEHGSLAHCLTEHGVPAAPGPIMGAPPGVDQQIWDQAMRACSTLGPGPGQPHS